MFPTPPSDSSESFNGEGTPQDSFKRIKNHFPDGSPESRSIDKFMELVKAGRQIVDNIMSGDIKTGKSAEHVLRQKVRDMGVKDEADVLAISSIIASFAGILPPIDESGI